MRRLPTVLAALGGLGLACGGADCPTLADAGGLRLEYAVAGDPAPVRAALQHRIEAVGPACASARVDGDAVVVEIYGPAAPEEVAALGVTGRLAIRPVVSAARAAALVAGADGARPTDDGLAGPAAALIAWRDAHAAALPAGVAALIEPAGPAADAKLHLVRTDSGLADVALDRVTVEEDGGRSRLLLSLSAADARGSPR
ncbi:MAG: hypothetical protein R3F59_30035 [Myxococcota bacterium]